MRKSQTMKTKALQGSRYRGHSKEQRKAKQNFCKQVSNGLVPSGFLIACAYPDRIACRRMKNSSNYRLNNGRSAVLNESDGLNQSEWLAVAEVGGSGRIGLSGHSLKL